MNDLFNEQEAESGPVECLGQTFPSDQARRAHYLKLLTEKLKDPEFRAIDGFSQGTDEAILAMSDPPYYTACPNPWLGDFVEHYGKPYDPNEMYSREPLAIDVSVGKTDQLYKAHSYHTKVPHLAIVPSILHYTNPGDIVLDGFAGSGNVPTQITNYLSKNFHDYRGLDKDDPRLIAKARERWYVPNPGNAQQLEQKREKALLKEFETYRAFSGRRIKETRLEVLRAGFKHAWTNKDFPTIIAIAKKIPETTLLEDEKLLLWYDQALTRMEAD